MLLQIFHNLNILGIQRIEQSTSKIKNLLYYAVVSKNMKHKKPIHLNFMFQKPFEPKLPLQKPENKEPNILNVFPKDKTILPNILIDLFDNESNFLFVFGKENNIEEAKFIPKIDLIEMFHMLIFLPACTSLLRIDPTQKHFFETNNVSDLIIFFGETPV